MFGCGSPVATGAAIGTAAPSLSLQAMTAPEYSPIEPTVAPAPTVATVTATPAARPCWCWLFWVLLVVLALRALNRES